MTFDNSHRLPKLQHNSIYETKIRPLAFADSKAVAEPHAILLGGQPGAGKTMVRNQAVDDLRRNGGAVVIDVDALRKFHPDYTALSMHGKRAGELTHGDARDWGQRLQDEAIQERRNIVWDATMGEPQYAVEFARQLQQSGYRVEARVMSTHETVSQLGIYQRYENELKTQGGGRWVDLSYHDKVYKSLPESVEALEKNKVASAMSLVRRGGTTVYNNKLEGGHWQKEPQAGDALRNDRSKQMDAEQIQKVLRGWDGVLSSMEQRGASTEEIVSAAMLRAQHEKMLLGQAERGPNQDAAEDFRTRRPEDAQRLHPGEQMTNALATRQLAQEYAHRHIADANLRERFIEASSERLAFMIEHGYRIEPPTVKERSAERSEPSGPER